MASGRRSPTEKKGHIDPNQAFFNRETDHVVATTCHVAARTCRVAARTRLVAARTKLVGGTTCHVAGRTKHVATRTCHVASRTKLVAARTCFVGATTKHVAARTLSSFDGISREQGTRRSSEVFQRDNDKIKWNRHAGHFHKICGARIKQREASSPVLPSERMGSQRHVAGAS